MKINFHNKLEIFVGDRYYVSYNKVLRTLYEKLSKLESYSDFFAFGSGKTELGELDTKLGVFVTTKPAVTTDLSCNPENGVFYVKKTATFDSSDVTQFSFSEIGLCSENVDNPTIYNHILVKDENGDPVTVTKNPGESLVVKLTIFLDLTLEDDTFLTLGENNLIKLLLGEKLLDNNIYAMRGLNMEENKPMQRSVPEGGITYKATIITSENQDGSYTLDIVCKLGEGATREVLFLIDNSVVARKNIMNERPAKSHTQQKTISKRNRFLLDEYVKDVDSLHDMNDIPITGFCLKNYGLDLGYRIDSSVLNEALNSQKTWKSVEGDKIAYLTFDKFNLIKISGNLIENIHTSAITATDIIDIAITENFVIVYRSVDPYLEIFKIENDVCVPQNFFKVNYDQSSYSYNFSSIYAIKLAEDHLKIGAILSSSGVGLVLDIVEDADGFNVLSILQSELTHVDKVLVCKRTPENAPKLIYITSTQDDPITPYCLQCFGENNSSIGYYSQAEFFMTAEGISIFNDFILVNISSSPYVYLYDTQNFERVSFAQGLILGNINGSNNDLYLVGKLSDGKYHAYVFVDEDNVQELDISKLYDIQDIKNVEIIEDLIFVYSDDENSSVHVFEIDKKYTIVCNVKSSSTDVIVSYKKYDLLGSAEYEGVQMIIKFLF